MARSQGQYTGLLRKLVPEAPNLYVDQGGVVRAYEPEQVPINEFGVPLRAELVKRAIAGCGDKMGWLGYLDVHHVAWSHTDYRALSTDDFESVGEAYRDLGAVKLRIPRQMHEYFHVGFARPPIPDEDVMVQFLAEDMQNRGILRVLLPDRDERMGKFIDDAREERRRAQLLDHLAMLPDGQVGHAPAIDYLAERTNDEVRAELLGRVSILRYAGGEFRHS